MKSLMDSLGDLAGLDMVLLREANFDPEAERLRSEPKTGVGWLGAALRRVVSAMKAQTRIDSGG